MSPNEMKNTFLFNSFAPHIHSISHEELLYELCVAAKHLQEKGRRFDATMRDVNRAFTWALTPQKDMWSQLQHEYNRNGGR